MIFLAFLAVLTWFVAAPLYRRRPPRGAAADEDERLQGLLDQLRELELDHRAGTIDDETFERERRPLEREAAAIMRLAPGRGRDDPKRT